MNTSDSVLKVTSLTKSFGKLRAVDNLDLEIKRGEIFGFLGRNGAGKTTTIRMLLGLIKPDAGSIELFGKSLHDNRLAILSRCGALVETASAYSNLSVREHLQMQASILRLTPSYVDPCMAELELEEYADKKAGLLSLGNKQRLALARALLGKPEFLILDEPVNGLDPAGIVSIRKLLRSLSEKSGMSILMSSHHLSEVVQTADRLGIIHRGKLVRVLTQNEVKNGTENAVLELGCDRIEEASNFLKTILRNAKIECNQGLIYIRELNSDISIPSIVEKLVGQGFQLFRVTKSITDIESIFMDASGDSK